MNQRPFVSGDEMEEIKRCCIQAVCAFAPAFKSCYEAAISTARAAPLIVIEG